MAGMIAAVFETPERFGLKPVSIFGADGLEWKRRGLFTRVKDRA
jgi:hypothetical protein